MSVVRSVDAFAHESGILALMNSTWGWPIAESLHFIGLTLLIGTVGLLDLRLLGLARSTPIAALHPLVRVGVAGFALNVTTGFCFFVSAPDQYLYNPAFQLKILCMLLAGLNVVWFYTVLVRGSVEFTVSKGTRAAAAISLMSWTGVITFGRLITFYRPPEHWCFWC